MSRDADHIRGLTVHIENNGLGAIDVTVDVPLCPGALVYSYQLCASTDLEIATGPLATLRLQDSELSIFQNQCCQILRADLPGLAWPAFAKLFVAADATATLNVTYGNCS